MTTPDDIDLNTHDRKLITGLIRHHLPDTEAWAYGSRIQSTAKPYSDLDIVVFTTKDQALQVAALREAFEESQLPFRVDLFAWNDLPDSFRQNITAKHRVLIGKPRL